MTGNKFLFANHRPLTQSPATLGGGVAQLGERLVRNEEVRGSNPLTSTNFSMEKWWTF